jgi:hypothetical protein
VALQACALLVNVFTLFIGLMLVITSFLEEQAIRAGQAFDSAQRNVISYIVFISNMFVLGLPVIRTLSEVPLVSKVKKVVSLCVRKDSSDTPVPATFVLPPSQAARLVPTLQSPPLPIAVGEIVNVQVLAKLDHDVLSLHVLKMRLHYV